jgi:hypothetical protein
VSLRESLQAVRARIDAACERAGRAPGTARLVAVSKTQSAQCVRAAIDAGQRLFGENRVQEALAKIDALAPAGEWHLIGAVQRNKARHVVGRFALLHGVDNGRLVDELQRRAESAGVVQPILIQVRLGGEDTKSGVDERGLAELVDCAVGAAALDLRGLMTIPPPAEAPEANRRWFARLRALRDAEGRRTGRGLPELSMGMSDDFEVAVEEGATLVRVGTAIFGPRRPA